MPGRHWSAADDAALTDVLAEGGTATEAAGELGRTARACQHRAGILGIARARGRQPDVSRRATLLEMIARGFTLNRAAQVMGVCSSTTVRMAWRLEAIGLVRWVGGRGRGGRYVTTKSWQRVDCQEHATRSDRRAELLRAIGEGLSINQAARRLHVSTGNAVEMAKRMRADGMLVMVKTGRGRRYAVARAS